jgi:hypothetical protein
MANLSGFERKWTMCTITTGHMLLGILFVTLASQFMFDNIFANSPFATYN